MDPDLSDLPESLGPSEERTALELKLSGYLKGWEPHRKAWAETWKATFAQVWMWMCGDWQRCGCGCVGGRGEGAHITLSSLWWGA